mgnify:CR=1 FL=1
MSVLLQVSDPHFGTEVPEVVEALVNLAAELKPDLVVGISAGSLVAALYASGKPGSELERLALQMHEAEIADWSPAVREQIEIDAKYSGYLEKEQEQVDKLKRLDLLRIPKDYNYARIVALSIEARQKMELLQPETLGQASRISGVSPADIQVLMVHLGR